MGEEGRISHQLKQNDDNRISFIVLLFLCFFAVSFCNKKKKTTNGRSIESIDAAAAAGEGSLFHAEGRKLHWK